MTLPHITPKQKEILHLLYRFRFLNRPQIQQLLHNPDLKNINTWLKDLHDKKYIGKRVDAQSKINTVPYIYHLSLNGIRYLKTQEKYPPEYLMKLYRESAKGQAFIEKNMFIADLYICLLSQEEKGGSFMFYTQSEYTRGGLIKDLSPDCLFQRDNEKQYVVCEIIKPKMPRFAIRARVAAYMTFFTSPDWTQGELPPQIVYICPTIELHRFIERFTAKYMASESITDIPVAVTTRDEVKQKGLTQYMFVIEE